MNQSRKIIVDFNIEFPPEMKPEFVAGVIRDYIHLLRFTVGLAEISIYNTNTRVIQQTIILTSPENVN